MWFRELVGFEEESPQQVRANLLQEGETLRSLRSGQSWACGKLSLPSLAELRDRAEPPAIRTPNTVREVVGDVTDLHADPRHAGAVFQVASQANLLEMVGPSVTPREGVDRYVHDATQGPACAVAAGAATIYRNYLAPVVRDGTVTVGQTEGVQLDSLGPLGRELARLGGFSEAAPWEMRNGYALPSRDQLEAVAALLATTEGAELDRLRGLVAAGLHERVQVTRPMTAQRVTQVFCTALPLAYAPHPPALWERLARVVLEGAYEATLRIALASAHETGCPMVFLTLLGGGAFGNPEEWILDAIERALAALPPAGLDVRIVSYGRSQPALERLLTG